MTSATPDSDDELVARFMHELQVSDPDRVVEEFCTLYPARAADFRSIGAAHRRLNAAAPEPAEVPPRLTPGEMLGDFRVVRLLSHGGMGEIYEAEQLCLSRRRVALKVIRHGRVSPDARARFLREQEVLARLHQTNIVPVFAAGERGEVQYFAMQYLDGAPLAHVVRFLRARGNRTGGTSLQTPSLAKLVESVAEPSPPAPPAGAPAAPRSTADANDMPGTPPVLSEEYCRSVAASLADVAEALDAAHRAGVLHRDVKPSNLMAERSGKCWVIDFGLAGLIGNPPTTPAIATAEPDPGLTATGAVMGTYAYMAPEQFDGEPDRRSDVWALGVTLYELLTLRRPFSGLKPDETGAKAAAVPTREEYCRQVREQEPVWPHRLAARAPADLSAICRKAMRKEPADRYPTAGEFAADLRRWLRYEPTQARGARPLRRAGLWARRNPGWAAAIVCALSAAVGLGVTGYQTEAARAETAEVRADAAEERAEAAEERERLAEQQRRFEQAVLESQQIRLGPPFVGWSRDSLRKLEEGRAIRPEADLRDAAAATLAGPDARHVSMGYWKRPGAVVGLSGVAFGSGGRLLAGGGTAARADGVRRSPALLFDANPARPPTESAQSGDGPVAFPDADSPLQLVLPAGDRWDLLLWNVGTNAKVAEFPLPGRGAEDVTAALSADARFAAGSVVAPTGKGERPGATILWSLDRRRPGGAVREVARWGRYASGLAFSPDGRLLAAGSEAGEVVVYSTADGAEVWRLKEGSLPVLALGFGRNYRRAGGDRPRPAGDPASWLLAVGCKGGDLAVWDLGTRARVNSFRGSRHDVHAVAFAPDGATLASAGRNVPLLWDVATGRTVLHLTNQGIANRTWMTGAAFSSDGRCVAVASTGEYDLPFGLDVFELDDGRGVRTYRGLSGVVSKVWVSPSRDWVAALAENWQLAVWRRETGEVVHVWDVPVGRHTDNAALAFDEVRGDVVFASGEWATRWCVATGERTDRWKLRPGLNDTLAVPPGGKPLLVRRERETPLLWGTPLPRMVFRCRELGEGGAITELYTLPDVTGESHNSYLSADGRYLLLNERQGDVVTPHLHHGLTGKPISFRHAVPLDTASYTGYLSEHGSALVFTQSAHNVPVRSCVLRLPELKLVSLHPRWGVADDDGLIGAHSDNAGIALERIGESSPLVTFALGRQVTSEYLRITGDGRYVGWGLVDGTVCVADVTRCLEQLTPFPRR